ncbi:MAG: hypothetical protein ABH950_05300 [Candidatus Altiarchaeota archaeon]
MDLEELKNLGKWLGLTDQQFDILKTIHKLELSGKRTNPKNIVSHYEKDHGKLILVSNLFHIFKALTDKNLIKKEKQATYSLNFSGIKAALDNHEAGLSQELTQFKEVKKKTKSYFEKIAKKETRPVVEYFDRIQFFNEMKESVTKANTQYIVAHFPKFFYLAILQRQLIRYDYLQVIQQRCMIDKTLEVILLTDFDLNFVLRDFDSFSVSKRDALKMGLATIDQIQYFIENYENLNVYYTEKLVGMDMVLPIIDEPETIYLYMRDQIGEITGGIKIKSHESAKQARETFAKISQTYTSLRSIKGKRIIASLRSEMRKRFKA